MTYDPHMSTLCRAVAGEMRQLSELVGQLATVLIGDDDIALRHIDELQKFDLIVQTADETAAVLDRVADGVASSEAVGVVRLEAIQHRLRSAMLAA